MVFLQKLSKAYMTPRKKVVGLEVNLNLNTDTIIYILSVQTNIIIGPN